MGDREDMGPKPSPDHSLDRIDNEGDYIPGNCRWATPWQQNNNSKHNRLLTYQGKTMTATQWARKLGIGPSVIINRLHRGWSVERTLSESVD